MPGKSRQAKGRPAHLSKKSRAKQRYTTAAPPPVAAAAPQPEAAAAPPAPKAPAAAPGKAKVMQYPYIAGELTRIAVLAVIIVVVLVVLSLVLS